MLLKKLNKVLVDTELTRGKGKVSNEDFTSDNVSANLVAISPTSNASIVKVISGNLGTGGILDNMYIFQGSSDETAVDLTAETYTDTNRWANTGLAWTNADAILLQDTSSMNYTIDVIERNNISGSLFSCPTLAGNESASGTLDFECSVLDVVGTEKGNLQGHKIVKQALGSYVQGGATVSPTEVTEVAEDAGTHDLYSSSIITDPNETLAIRVSKGSNTNAVIDFGGNVADTLTMNITAGELANFSTAISGTSFFGRAGDDVLGALSCDGNPFVAKYLAFNVAGNVVKASDVTLTFGNTNVDRQYVQDGGTSDKALTEKSAEVSFTEDAVDLSNLDLFKGNTDVTLYVKLVNAEGAEIVIFFPRMRVSNIDNGDDSGVLTEGITLTGFADVNNKAYYVATKR